jgi:hypothetical protein
MGTGEDDGWDTLVWRVGVTIFGPEQLLGGGGGGGRWICHENRRKEHSAKFGVPFAKAQCEDILHALLLCNIPRFPTAKIWKTQRKQGGCSLKGRQGTHWKLKQWKKQD